MIENRHSILVISKRRAREKNVRDKEGRIEKCEG
jgi:hypothetical protein